MDTLQILIIALPVVALTSVLLMLIYSKPAEESKETGSDLDIDQPVVKPKRRYKKRKKKTAAVHSPVPEAIVKKNAVGRPKKSN